MPRVVPSEITRVIDQYFSPWASQPTLPTVQLGLDHVGNVSAVISLIDRLPSSLVTLPPTGFVDLVANLETLRGQIRIAVERGGGYVFNGGAPIWHLRRLLAECSDESTEAAGHDLRFVKNKAFRHDLLRDISEAYDSLNAGRWKAATVLAGSGIEALLVWKLATLTAASRQAAIVAAITVPKNRPNGAPDRWLLWQLIEVAAAAGIVKDQTKQQILLAKDYRNLIHPGVVARKSERCGKDTALGALSGLERVIHDVRP